MYSATNNLQCFHMRCLRFRGYERVKHCVRRFNRKFDATLLRLWSSIPWPIIFVLHACNLFISMVYDSWEPYKSNLVASPVLQGHPRWPLRYTHPPEGNRLVPGWWLIPTRLSNSHTPVRAAISRLSPTVISITLLRSPEICRKLDRCFLLRAKTLLACWLWRYASRLRVLCGEGSTLSPVTHYVAPNGLPATIWLGLREHGVMLCISIPRD
jgi:hypothetical protein